MKINSKLFNAVCIILVSFGIMLTTGCGDDPVEGCTDPAAENYNASADEDDGSCVYARDQFIGQYSGTLACAGLLSTILDSDDLQFSITPGVGQGVNDVIINLQGDVPVGFTATASGNSLSINTQLNGLPLDLTGDGNDESVDVTVTGTVTINGNTLDGTLNVTAAAGPIEIMDNCAITGTKQ